MSFLTCSIRFQCQGFRFSTDFVGDEDGYTASKLNVTLTAHKTVEVYAKMWHPLPYKAGEPKVLASV